MATKAAGPSPPGQPLAAGASSPSAPARLPLAWQDPQGSGPRPGVSLPTRYQITREVCPNPLQSKQSPERCWVFSPALQPPPRHAFLLLPPPPPPAQGKGSKGDNAQCGA